MFSFILDIDDCESVPCKNNATCIDGIDEFSCQCSPGYYGDNCTESKDHILIYHYVIIVCEKSYLDFNFTSIDLKLNKFDINYSIIRQFAKGQTKCREKLPRCHITKTYGINNFELLKMFAKHTVAPTKYRATQVL